MAKSSKSGKCGAKHPHFTTKTTPACHPCILDAGHEGDHVDGPPGKGTSWAQR